MAFRVTSITFTFKIVMQNTVACFSQEHYIYVNRKILKMYILYSKIFLFINPLTLLFTRLFCVCACTHEFHSLRGVIWFIFCNSPCHMAYCLKAFRIVRVVQFSPHRHQYLKMNLCKEETGHQTCFFFLCIRNYRHVGYILADKSTAITSHSDFCVFFNYYFLYFFSLTVSRVHSEMVSGLERSMLSGRECNLKPSSNFTVFENHSCIKYCCSSKK